MDQLAFQNVTIGQNYQRVDFDQTCDPHTTCLGYVHIPSSRVCLVFSGRIQLIWVLLCRINLTKRYDVYEIPDLWVLVVGKWQHNLTRSTWKAYSLCSSDSLSVSEKDNSKLFLSFVKTGTQICLHDCDRFGMLVCSIAFTVRLRSGSSPQPNLTR